MFSDITPDPRLETGLRMPEGAFESLGGVPEEIIYDPMKTGVLGRDARGETPWNPVFIDFAGDWGFTPRRCRPYRPQTKGKTESGGGDIKKSFVPGRTAPDLGDLQSQHREGLGGVANRRVPGTTHRVVMEAGEEERPSLQPGDGRPSYPYEPEIPRRGARDASLSFQSSRSSVPGRFAGQEVSLKQIDGRLEMHREGKRIASHGVSEQRRPGVTDPDHPWGIPSASSPGSKKPTVRVQPTTPEGEVRSLEVYAGLAGGDGASCSREEGSLEGDEPWGGSDGTT